jgi:ABC-2 type transport system ATP-binding protein
VQNVIEVRNLSKNYGQIKALDQVTLAVPRGSIFGYLGPNGAGKTTTMKIILGLLRYSHGSVRVFGQEVKVNSVELKKKVGFLPDAEMPNGDSITRFLTMTCKMNDIKNRKERISEISTQLGLGKLCNRKIGNLSKGQKQRVGIANALITDPELLILDEPNNGLDPLARVRILSLLKELAKEGKTILLSSHIIGEVDKIATDIAIIHLGRVIEQSKRKDLYDRYLSQGRYIIAGKLDIDKVTSLDYVDTCEQDFLDRYVITTTGNVPNEQFVLDLILKCDSKIEYFTSSETNLEDLFLESINGQLREGVSV